MGQGGNVIAELRAAHREVQDLVAPIQALPPGDEQRRTLADRFVIEPVPHVVAEEMYLYPTVRGHVPVGGMRADQEIQDHTRVERLLKDMGNTPVSDARFDALVDRLMSEVSAHLADE